MRLLYLLYVWTFKHLPRRFSIPILVIVGIYFLLVFPTLVYRALPWLTDQVINYFHLNFFLSHWVSGREIISALLTIGAVVLGGVVSYGLAGGLYRLWRKNPMKQVAIEVVSPNAPSGAEDEGGPLKNYHRIGIILAGGGAKGAYQAGALKAIYEFLEDHRAHQKVKMIAGTSIGSWNALFWLADLIKAPHNNPGLLEQWWSQVDVCSVIQPAFYTPFRQNYLLSNQPWQETFDVFFGPGSPAHTRLLHHIEQPEAPDALHFYFTRSNVARGHLEFTTNHTNLGAVKGNLPNGYRPRPPVLPDTWQLAHSVEDIRTAVFSSMDLPPLFEYAAIDGRYFEDGGVVDNLPIRFGTEIEGCDLLFILPLNATFEQAVNMHSVARRLFRVMDVRQGVLERNSFKMVYLYNELAGLRKQIESGELKARAYEDTIRWLLERLQQINGPGAEVVGQLTAQIHSVLSEQLAEDPSAERAHQRRHKQIQVFSICPAPELAINTAEFWKTQEAQQVFQVMYTATRNELAKFFAEPPDLIRMALVSPYGTVTYLEDF